MKFFLLFSTFFCFSFFLANGGGKTHFDLSNRNFENKIHSLDGEWDFIWDSDLTVERGVTKNTIPGFWNQDENGGYPSFGQAIYSATLKVPVTKDKLCLKINNIHSSYHLLINGELVHEHGSPQKSIEGYHANWSPYLYPLNIDTNQFEITFIVANHGHRNGGFASSVYVGRYPEMIKDREFYMSVDAFIIGGLFLLGIFLLSMYILWRKDNSLLYFLGFTLFFALWSSFRDEKVFFSIWNSFDWLLALRIEYLSMVISVTFFIVFISRLFPKQNIKLIQQIVLTINALSFIVIILFPPQIFTYVALSNIVTLVVSMIYIIVVFVKAIKSKEFDNVFTTISLIILFIFLTLKVLNFLELINVNKTFLDLTTLLFVLSMALIFANRFSGFFNSILQLKNQAEEQQRDLKLKNKEVLASIQYAKQLQSTILPTKSEIKAKLPNSFVLYEPKDIVSGDFYWMEERNNLVYFAAADCTGHGVPGAMVSFVCSNALTKSVIEDGKITPNEILDRTRELVIERFSTSETSLSDGMDISLAAYNRDTQELFWAGANNPIWLVRKGENLIHEIKGNKQPIGSYATSLEAFTLHKIQINKGDRIYLFSDGYVDQFGGVNGKKFKTNNLKKLVLDIQIETIETQKEILLDTFFKWQGDFEQIDDVCVFGIEF